MRIAINGAFWGQRHTGSGEYLHQLVTQLQELAPRDEIVLLSPSWAASSPQTGAVPCRLRTPSGGLGTDLAKLWFEQVAFARACRRQNVDLAHVPYFAPPFFPGVPTLVTIHDLIPLLLPAYRGSLLARLYTGLAVAAARRAALILTDSNASRQDIICHLGVASDRVRVIPLAAAAAYVSAAAVSDRDTVAEKYGLPPAYFLYLGGFDQRKNVGLLLRAFAQAVRDTSLAPAPEPWLVVAGRLPERGTAFRPDPVRMAQEIGVAQRVIFTGWIPEEDKPALYSGALAFLFPSQYEGFGLPPLESMACGTPVIASDSSSLPEVVGLGGLLVPPNDVSALARAMVDLWDDATLRRELGRRARHQASRFSWTRTAQATLVAYRDVAAEHGLLIAHGR